MLIISRCFFSCRLVVFDFADVADGVDPARSEVRHGI